jgi:hypothetical protein
MHAGYASTPLQQNAEDVEKQDTAPLYAKEKTGKMDTKWNAKREKRK